MGKLARRAAKRDKNEPEIMQALKAVQCTVQQLSDEGVPDLLVGFTDPQTGQRSMILMEVKDGYNKLTPPQAEWHLWWGGTCPVIVRSIEDALRAIGRA